MNLLCSAFDATLKKFEIKGLDLAQKADVTSSAISNFRHGTAAIRTDTLERMLATFSDEAFSYWVSQLIHSRKLKRHPKSPMHIQTIVNQLDDVSTAELLQALANKLRTEAKGNA